MPGPHRSIPISSLCNSWATAEPSLLAKAVADRGTQSIIDLVGANPQQHGFAFPQDQLLDILSRAAVGAEVYLPDPRGNLVAREAVAAYHGSGAGAEQVILTPGTSLGYYYAFRLLAQPGDDILCPAPTYPLFDDLARLAGLNVRYYHLEQQEGSAHWGISEDELEFQVTPRTRAIVIVSPHNPTGSIMARVEMEVLARVATRHGIPCIFDEVFRECVHGKGEVVWPSAYNFPLCITLNGISKMLSLPGLKGGWMVVEGEVGLRDSFLSAAEYLSDLFLPVSEVTQHALPELLASLSTVGVKIRKAYQERMRDYVSAWHGQGFEQVALPEGTPYLCVSLRPMSPEEEEALTVKLVTNHGVLTHPGALYRLPSPHLVTTCVHSPPWPLEKVFTALADYRI